MTRQKFAILLVTVSFLALQASRLHAREDWFLLTWDVSFATGDTRSFIDEPGWRGFGVEGRSFVTDNLETGFVLGWHNLYQETRDATVQKDNVTVGGTQARFLDLIPILGGANYHFFDRSYRIRPYVGVKGGAYWVRQRVEIGFLDVILNRNWHLGVAPEAGFTFLTGTMDIYGFVAADYNYIAGRKGSIDYTYWGANLGLAFVF